MPDLILLLLFYYCLRTDGFFSLLLLLTWTLCIEQIIILISNAKKQTFYLLMSCWVDRENRFWINCIFGLKLLKLSIVYVHTIDIVSLGAIVIAIIALLIWNSNITNLFIYFWLFAIMSNEVWTLSKVTQIEVSDWVHVTLVVKCYSWWTLLVAE